MFSISKEEATKLRVLCPKVHITRTMKGKSSRHRYYCDESKEASDFLKAQRKNLVEKEG